MRLNPGVQLTLPGPQGPGASIVRLLEMGPDGRSGSVGVSYGRCLRRRLRCLAFRFFRRSTTRNGENGLGPRLRAEETVTNASPNEAGMFRSMIELSTPASVNSRLQRPQLTVRDEIAPAGIQRSPSRGQTKEES